MQLSKKTLNSKFEKEIKQTFSKIIADISSPEKAEKFLRDFLTSSEYLALSKRLAIIKELDKGSSYQEIKQKVKVSSATIANIQSQLENKNSGIQMALQYIKANEWATKWTEKITNLFNR